MSELQQVIEQAFENRADINPANVDPAVKNAVLEAIDLLDSGAARVAEPNDDGWRINPVLRQGRLQVCQ